MKLDKKFYGHIYKIKDDSQVPSDEYVVFLAGDTAFYFALLTYQKVCAQLGADSTQIAMVEELVENVRLWRDAHPEQCKVPDAADEVRLP